MREKTGAYSQKSIADRHTVDFIFFPQAFFLHGHSVGTYYLTELLLFEFNRACSLLTCLD